STALDAWRGERDGLPRVGFLGGGSDHVSFLALCAVPSVALGARGAPGSAYHSLYDDLAWYRRIVGNDYASAALVTRITAVAVDRAAHAPVLLYDLAEPARALGRTARGLGAEHERVLDAKAVAVLVDAADTQAARATRLERTLGESVAELSDDERRRVRVAQRQLERAWLHEPGLPGRPWYRNLYTAPDETSGYAAWPLPGLQKAIHESDAKLGSRQLELLRQVLVARGAALDSIESALDRDGSTAPPR
ncbi:MAG: transferrin receptor-like dimerization domain-containing protein, partial [Planctomycetota bacterium]